jgi:hypothetical protein
LTLSFNTTCRFIPANRRPYLSLINGLTADQIFTTANPTLQNETTARFTFFTDAVTERVISNGRLRIVNRIGTTTIYLDETPDGDFSNRDTFRNGTPILTMAYRQQVILDSGEGISGISGTGTFTVMNLLTVTVCKPLRSEARITGSAGAEINSGNFTQVLHPRRPHPAAYSPVTRSSSSEPNQTRTRNRI